MADIERTAMITIDANSKKAEKKFEGIIKWDDYPITLNVDADIQNASKSIETVKKSIEELQKMLKALTNQGKDGDILKLNVAGIDGLQKSLTNITKSVSLLQRHFIGLNNSINVGSELEKQINKVNEYSTALKKLSGSIQSNENIGRAPKKDIKELFSKPVWKNNLEKFYNKLNNQSFAEYESNNVPGLAGTKRGLINDESAALRDTYTNILRMITRIVAETGTFDHKIETVSGSVINLSNLFDKIQSSIIKTTDNMHKESLSWYTTKRDAKGVQELGSNGRPMTISLDEQFKQRVQDLHLDTEIEDMLTSLYGSYVSVPLKINLEKKLERVKEYEESGTVKVNIDKESIQELSSAIEELRQISEESATVGLQPEQVEAITESFIRLETILTNINTLLSHFDVNIKEDATVLKDTIPLKPRTERKKTTTKTRHVDGANGGMNVTTTDETATGTSPIAPVASTSDQSNLQGQLKNTSAQAKKTKKDLQEVNEEANRPKQRIELDQEQDLHGEIQTKINDGGPFKIKLEPDEEGGSLHDAIQGKINEGDGDYLAKVDLDPASPLKDSIDKLLGETFNINVGLNNNGFVSGDSPSKIITDMMEADKFMGEYVKGDPFERKEGKKKVNVTNPRKERGFYFNTQTGYHTNPYVFDAEDHFSGIARNKMLEEVKNANEMVDAFVHTHSGDKYARMSINNKKGKNFEGDIFAFYQDYIDGVVTQITAGLEDVEIFNSQAFYEDVKKLGYDFSDSKQAQKFVKKFDKIEDQDALKSLIFENKYYKDALKYFSEADGSHITNKDLLSFFDPNYGSEVHEYLRGHGLGKLHTSNIIDFAKNKLPKDFNGNFAEIVQRYVADLLNDYTGEGTNTYLTGFNKDAFESTIFSKINNRGRDNYILGKGILDKISFDKMGINWDDYVQHVTTEEFKKMYTATSGEKIDLGIDTESISKKIKDAITGEKYEIDVTLKEGEEGAGVVQSIKTAVENGTYQIDVGLKEDNGLVSAIQKLLDETDFKVKVGEAEQEEKKQDSETQKPPTSVITDTLEERQRAVNRVIDNTKYKIKKKDENMYPEKRLDYDTGYLYTDEEYAQKRRDYITEKYQDISDIINDSMKAHPTLFADLNEEAERLKQNLNPIQEMVDRISQGSSINGIKVDDIAKEAGNARDIIDQLDKENKQDTEEYIIAQEKIWKLLEHQMASYGGVKASGAKDASQLRSWIFKSWEQDTGKDFGNVIDTIFGGGRGGLSILDSRGEKFSMRDLATEILGYSSITGVSGAMGARVDTNRLQDINRILSFIKDNNLDISNQIIPTQITEQADEVVRSIDDIASAYERMQEKLNRSGSHGKDIQYTLQGHIYGLGEGWNSRTTLSQLKNAHEAYDTAISEKGPSLGYNWEDEYSWAVRFVDLFEDYKEKGGTEKSLAQHEELYNKLKPLVSSYREELQKVIDFKPTAPTEQMGNTTGEKPPSEIDAALDAQKAKVDEVVEAEKQAFQGLIDTISQSVPEAIETKNKAFQKEVDVVQEAVDQETKIFDTFAQNLQGIGDSLNIFENWNGFAGFKNMISDIKSSEEALQNFVTILKATKSEQEQAIRIANDADKVTSEEVVDPSQWSTLLDKYGEVKAALGDIVDIRRQIRVDEKTGEEYLSFKVTGEHGNAIFGQNGTLLRANYDYSSALSDQKRAAKEEAEAIKATYNNALDAIKEYGEAATQVNNLEKDFTSGKTVDEDQMTDALEREAEAVKNVVKALTELYALRKQGKISDKDIESFEQAYAEQERKVTNSYYGLQNARAKKENTEQYESQIAIIKEAINARNEYNQLQADQILGQSTMDDASIQAINNAIDETKAKAQEARQAIEEMFQAGAISAKEYDNAMALYQQSMFGDDKTVQLIDDAYVKADIKEMVEAKKAVDEYYNAAKKVEELQDQLASGKNVGKQLLDWIDKMTKAREDAEKGLQQLQTFATRGYSDVLKDVLPEAESNFSMANLINNGVNNSDVTIGFENINRAYQTLITNADRYIQILQKKQSGQALTFNELTWLSKYAQYYQDAADGAGVFTEKGNEATAALKAQYEQAMLNANNNAIKKSYEDIGEELSKLKSQTWNDQGNQQLDAMNQKYQTLTETITNLSTATKEQKEAMKGQMRDLLEDIGEFQGSRGQYIEADKTSVATLNRRMSDWIAKNTSATDFIPQVQSLQKSLDGISVDGLKKVSAEFENIKASAAEAGKTGLKFGDTLKKSFGNMARYLMTYASFYRIIGTIKQAINIVKEYDTAMMEIKKVSNESAEAMDNLKTKSFDMGNQIGSTGKDILKSVASWKRLGKSFEESQEAAVASNWLLNVSEFTNIDDATKSLVSITQAFDDLSYESAIDKLNGVGDAFSSSTDQIASGMQNVSSVLQVAGNNVDQSIALLAAANDVTQDMSKASMGVRTVALRIAGTQDAKEQLETLGEDTSDFIVQTTSKVDAKVRKYTATAKTPGGISVLDEKGRLRDTYSILLDIAKVWDDIVESDNKFGTNRSNALLELLAGKTRSNVLASILQAPDILERAYETSLNSAGVGQRELDIYMDSIQAKTTQLSNSFQEIANLTIDSEGLKTLLDIVNALLSGVTALAEKFGGFNLLIGGIAGGFLQKNGFGILPNMQGKGGWASLFGNMFSKQQTVEMIPKFEFTPLEESLQTAIKGFDMDDKLMKQLNTNEYAKGLFTSSQAFKDMANNMSEAELNAISLGDAVGRMQRTVTYVPVQAASGFAKLATGIKSVASAALTAATAMAAMFIISEIAKAIYNFATAQERAIKAGQEAQESIKDLSASYDKTKQSITDIKDEYAKLSEGVSIDRNGNAQNINLSEEEFNRYLELSKQIAEIAPELVTGYNDQGEAVVNLGNTVDGVTQQLNDFLKVERDIANAKIGEDLDTLWKGLNTEARKYAGKAENEEGVLNNYLKSQVVQIKTINDDMKEEVQDILTKETTSITVGADFQADLRKKLTELGVERGQFLSEDGTAFTYSVDLSGLDEKELKSLKMFVNGGKYDEQRQEKFSEAQIKKFKLLADSTYKKAIPSIQSYVDSTFLFDNVEEQMQDKFRDGFKQIFSKVDYKSVSQDIEDVGGLESWVDGMIASMMASDETQDAFEGLINLAEERGQMTYPQIVKARNAYYKVIQDAFIDEEGNPLYTRQDLDVFFGYATKDTQGNIKYNTKGRYEDAVRKMGFSKEDADKLAVELNKVKSEYADAALAAIESKPQAEAQKILGAWDQWWNYIKPYLTGEKKIESSKEGALIDIFNDELYKTHVEDYDKHLSSITGTLETLREEGSLTAEAMRDLQEEFPDLTDFSYGGISDYGTQELSKWIGEFKDGWTDFSDEGQKQLDTYISNMVASYRKISVTEQSARKELSKSATAQGFDEWTAENQISQGILELQERYGEDLNWNIVLALQDQFSGDVNDLIAKYGNYKLVWDIELRKENIQREIDSLTRNREIKDAELSLNEALGISKTRGDIESDNTLSDQLIKLYDEQRNLAIDEIKKSYTDENGNLNLDDYGLSLIDTENAEADKNILAERTKQAQNYAEMREAALKPYEQALKKYQNNMAKTQRERDRKSAQGWTNFTEENNQDIADLTDSNETLQEEINVLKAQEQMTGSILSFFHQQVDTNDQIIAIQDQITEKEQEIADNNLKIDEKRKENAQYPVNTLKAQYDKYHLETQRWDNEINKQKNAGNQVSESTYSFAIHAAETERDKAQEVYDQMLQDRFDLRQKLIGEYGKDYDFDTNEEWTTSNQAIEEQRELINGLIETIRGYKTERNSLGLTSLQNKGTIFDLATQEANRVLEKQKENGVATEKSYVNAINASNDQLNNLFEQRNEIYKNKKKFEDDFAKDEANKGKDIMQNEEYLNFFTQLADNQEGIDNLRNSIKGLNDELNNLDVVKLQNYGNEILQRQVDDANKAITDKKNLGLRVDKIDYQNAIDSTLEFRNNTIEQMKIVQKEIDDYESAYKNVHGSLEGIENINYWSSRKGQVDEFKSSIDSADESVKQLADDMKSLAMIDLEFDSSRIQREMDKINREINDPKNLPTAGTYIRAMQKNVESQANIYERIAEKEKEGIQTENGFVLFKDLNEDSALAHTEGYDNWGNELANLESQLYDTKAANDQFLESLMQLPANNLTKGIKKYEEALEDLQTAQDFKTTQGFQISEGDLDENIRTQGLINTGRSVLDFIYKGLDEGIKSGQIKPTQEFAENIHQAMRENQNQIISGRTNIFNWGKQKKELPYTKASEQLEMLSRQAERTQMNFDNLEASGKKVTQQDYQRLIDTNNGLKFQAQIVRDEALRLRNETKQYDSEGRLTSEWIAYDEQYLQAQQSVDGYIDKLRELSEAQQNLPLTELQQQMTIIQDQATNINDLISLNEAKGIKPTVKDYDRLAKNSKEQMNNLKKQNDILKQQGSTLDKNGSKYRDIQNQIAQNNSAISQAEQQLMEYNQQAAHLLSTQAEELTSAITTAFSEMNSETGISVDTMEQLKKSFSDLTGHDISNLFYESSDGMKMNTRAAEALIDAEYALQTNNLKSEIELQNKIIERQSQLQTENAQKAVEAAQQRISAAQQELAMIQALYDEQKKQFTGYQQWQNAQQTENAGKRYEDMQGAWKNIKEMYSQGMTGTDDFKSFVSIFDKWGGDTVQTYERIQPMLDRYLTEDYQGIKNFYDDVVAKGFGTLEEGVYNIQIPSVEEAADALEMSVEGINIMMSRGEDYGFTNDWVESRLDGQEKIRAKTQELIEAQEDYIDAATNGAPQEVLDDLQGVIDTHVQSLQNLRTNTEAVTAREGKITSTEIQNAVNTIQALNKLMHKAPKEERQAYQDEIERIAKEYEIPLQNFHVDKEALDYAFEGWNLKIKPSETDQEYTAERVTDQEAFESGTEKVRSGWNEADAELQTYISDLQGIDKKDLETIMMNDGKYTEGLETAEKALDNIADKLGMSRTEAEQLVPILERLGMLNEDADNIKTYNKPSEAPQTVTANETKKETMSLRQQATETANRVENITQVVTTKYQEGAITPEEIQQMSLETFNATFNVNVQGEEELQQIKDNIAEISQTDGFDFVVKLDQSTIEALTTTDKSVNVNTDDATKAINDVSDALDKLQGQECEPKITADNSQARQKISETSLSLTILNNTPANPTISVNDQATTILTNIKNKLDQIKSKTITITVSQSTIGGGLVGNGGHADFAFGTAHASGTAYAMWTSYRHGIGAYADGTKHDWTIQRDEDALLNELAPQHPESIVRDGYWQIIPGGPHVEHLKKGDII